MKRFLLTICVLALITAIHAQSVVNTPIKRMISQDEVSNVASSTSILTSNTNTAVPTVIWSDNFSSASNWVFTNQSIPSLDWSIETDPMAIPVSVLAPFASATASDGFLFINSDATGGGDNDGTPVIVTATSVQMIDCSSSPYVQISFSHNYRWWHDTRGVRISGDGGVTWNEPNTILYPNGGSITDENNYPSDQNSGNPEITTYDISAFAGGRDSVMVQFYYDDNDYWGWYWAVDDVSISEIPDNGLAIQDEVFGGWWVNYVATGGLGQNYTQYPMNQATANPYAFEAVLKNTGIATQSVTMYADITGPTGMTTSHTSNSISLAVTEQDTFAATTTYTPTMNGVYTIEMWGVADSAGLGAVITNTDITTKTTEVTTDIYGKDLGTQEGYWRLSRTGNYPGGFEVGADYDIYTNDELYAVDVYLTDWSIPGTAIYASLYEIDADPNLDPIPLSVSDDHIISSGEPGSWITIPFLSPQPLLQGTTYSISLGGYMHPLDSAGIGVAGNGYASSDRLFDKDDHYQNGAPTWYTIGDIPMLRMNFNNDLISSITENNTAIFNVFPNPTNGVFTINSDFDSKYTIEVRNIIGELVYTTSTTELEKTIDLSKFGKGVYTVEIINKENIIQTEKIILE